MVVQLVYSFFYFVIRYIGLAAFFRLFLARNAVSIITYHKPDRDVFEAHLNYLSAKYNLIAISELIDAVKLNNFNKIPRYAMVITLDDGWKENYELLPVIQKYQFKPTVFLTSHLINTKRHFWWTTCNEIEKQSLKRKSNSEKLLFLKEKYHFYLEKEFEGERQTLNKSEIKEMSSYVEYGFHTCYHPILTQCNSEEKRKEIIEGKVELERMLGIEIQSFAYPNGDYDDECIDILKECGMKIARSTDAGWNGKSLHPFKLKITGVSDNASMNKFVAELTGIPMFFQYLFKGSFNGIKNKITNN
ncbi:polysaccharide deacetylase family protein [Marinilabiliaceae bacterium JC017]|nr:polysaccharide deacetylase family protein [Marinilabiliaceae bacterium JC017]